MNLLLQYNNENTLATSQLIGHDETSKQLVYQAVELLLKYKSTVHEFTDEIIDFWSLPRRVMTRYQFDDAEQLNEWLDNLTS
jgi:hypothetical protein